MDIVKISLSFTTKSATAFMQAFENERISKKELLQLMTKAMDEDEFYFQNCSVSNGRIASNTFNAIVEMSATSIPVGVGEDL